MKAVVIAPVCPIMTQPRRDCELADEALFGMVVEVLEQTNADYWRVRTHYRYEGYARADCLLAGDQAAAAWETRERKVIFHKNSADVMHEPKVQSWPLVTLPLGALVAPVEDVRGCEDDAGWTLVELPDSRRGYVRTSWLDTYFDRPVDLPEDVLRARLVSTAMLYKGTQYRWGGKTPMGIDCSGLVSMSYLLNGMVIYRDAHIKPDFDMIEIDPQDMKPGDAIFFKGHVALYIGSGRYIHSTGKAGSDGVDINSLNPADPDYREDLTRKIEHIGSFTGFQRK